MISSGVVFLWDDRPGKNVEHIRRHGLTPELWERVYSAASRRQPDKDDATIEVAEGRVARRLYRIVYEVLSDRRVRPIEIFPITGFAIHRHGLDR
jgi:hypothetical protein